MASYSGAGRTELNESRGNDNEMMLANALRRMDGLIGYNISHHPHPNAAPLTPDPLTLDPLATSIITQCEILKALVIEWEERREGGSRGRGGRGDGVLLVRNWIQPETRQYLASWLTGTIVGQPIDHESQQRVELLIQELSEVRLKLRETESQSEMLSQQLHTTQQKLESRDTEITLLSREREYWPSGVTSSGHSMNRAQSSDSHLNQVSTHSGNMVDTSFQRMEPQRRSLKKTLAKAFTRKKTPSLLNDQDRENTPHMINVRESAFNMKDGHQLGEWAESVGLDMYRGLIETHVPSGERLVAMTKQHDLVHIGIVNTLHRKKLHLAVKEAIAATPTPLAGLGHDWVAEWLKMIGLPGYVRTFAEARIDGHMLDVISMGDLDLLEVNDPFHLLSIQRAIQAFRMCGYNPNYLKDSAAASQGSQKLLHWTALDVRNWLWNINLDQYVGALDNVGLHGALMLLEVRFNSESLARLLGIHGSQVLICKHLTKNFMELLGPVAAQLKMDAMQSKNFQCIMPTDKGKVKGHGKKNRRGKSDDNETLLCSLAVYPATDPSQLITRPLFSSIPLTSSTPVISRHSAAT